MTRKETKEEKSSQSSVVSNQPETVECTVVLGMIHEGGNTYSNGQKIILSADRAAVRIADGSVVESKSEN